MKIRTKFIVVNALIVIIALASITSVCLVTFKHELVRQAMSDQESRLKTFWELLYAKGHDVKIVNGKLMAGAYTVNGDFSLPDRLKEICGGSATIFMGDERVSTNVLKEDGTRASRHQAAGTGI